jgi:hypothetical protein
MLTAVHWSELHGPQLMAIGMAVTAMLPAFIGNSMSEVVVEVVR